MREAILRAVSTNRVAALRFRDEKIFMTSSLLSIIKDPDAGYDADPFTGNQEPENFVVDNVSSILKTPNHVIVSIKFSNSAVRIYKPVIRYDVVLTSGRWKIDDITYHLSAKSIKESYAKAKMASTR